MRLQVGRIRTAALAVLAAASVVPALAQTAPAPNASSADQQQLGEPVKMSEFVVRTTQGFGYSEGNAASAMKGSQSLMSIPQQVLVVSSDLIKDINSNNSSDIMQYVGVSSYYRGPTVEARGSRVGNPYLEDIPQSVPLGIEDNFNVDAYEVIKGPTQIYYPGASLGGIVIKTAKKPIPGVDFGEFSIAETNWGGNRDMFDLNKSYSFGADDTLSFRLIGVYQGGDAPFQNVSNRHECVYPVVEWDYKNSKVIVGYDVQVLWGLPGGLGTLTPTGDWYSGYGRRFEGSPPNNNDKGEQHDLRITLLQKLSDNWEAKIQAAGWTFGRSGIAGFPTTVNWNTGFETYTPRRDDAWTAYADEQADFHGKYLIGKFANESSTGFIVQDSTSLQRTVSGTGQPIQIGNTAAVNAIVWPYINPPASGGVRAKGITEDGYYMHTIDVIPNWLTLLGGLTYSYSESISIPTTSSGTRPFTSTDNPGHQTLHRLAAMVHLTKDVMLYGLESTSYSLSSGTTYLATPLPNVVGKDDEVGFKTSFLDGKLSSAFAIYKMTLTNQSVNAPIQQFNIVGINYQIPIGTTTSEGFEGYLAWSITPGWELLATFYRGTVHDQNGNPITQTYENSWSAFTRYDFQPTSPLHGLGISFGANRMGGRWFNMSGLTLPGAAPLPVNSSGNSIFKLHEGTNTDASINYRLNKHWTMGLHIENVFDVSFPQGCQGVGLVDPADPRTYTLTVTTRY